ncbi:ASCH domain-containing protein [Euzebya sp.]|uniref:ASCH domain-containing protein n=1 Tax=Euzebya sp. TaxID=1971409 RepID=UPI0035185D1A
MKALTVRQPWASLIVLGVKDVENRSWSAPAGIIGQRIAIHAGKTHNGNEFRSALITARWGGLPGDDEPNNTMRWIHAWWANRDLPYGAVIGTAVVADCHQCDGGCSPWAVRGRDWHWSLTDVTEAHDPVEMNGRLGLWEVSTHG